MNKIFTGLLVLIFLLSTNLFFSLPASAHSISTATGVSVSHTHYGKCKYIFWGCPDDDEDFRKAYGFNSADQTHTGTAEWNCHGRTFDGRRSWINPSDAVVYLANDRPFTPINPGYGDAVIFYDSSGNNIHSETVVGSWSGASTMISSKYGADAEYKHAIADSVKVYGSKWNVTRFGAGTPIYSLTSVSGAFDLNSTSLQEKARQNSLRLLEEQKQMPWYSAVLETQKLYEEEHPKIVARISGLRENTQEKLAQAQSKDEQIAILVNDLVDPSHFTTFGAFNTPLLAHEFVSNLEAGKELVKRAEKNPEVKNKIVTALESKLNENNQNISYDLMDRKQGAVIYFLQQLLSESEQSKLKEMIQFAPEGSYTEFYLEKGYVE